MEPITATVVATYIAEKILEQFIQEEAGYMRIWHYLCPPKTFKSKLAEVIDKTTTQFEKVFPPPRNTDQFPFYQSQVFFDQLNKFILFKKNTIPDIETELKAYPKIIKPSEDELNYFYELFVTNVYSETALKKLYIDTNYKSQIFDISARLDGMEETINQIKVDAKISRSILEQKRDEEEKLKITEEILLRNLRQQVNRQLKKQVNSGKYLPNTFIEIGQNKDLLRYLCDPLFYCRKCVEEIDVLDFRLLNIDLLKHQKSFTCDLKSVRSELSDISLKNLDEHVSSWLSYLNEKRQEISSMTEILNERPKFGWKLDEPITNLEFLKSKVALITETAGQGKTNFVCDFVDNFLNRRNIPALFLIGTEISPTDIRQTIVQRIFPGRTDVSWTNLMTILKNACHNSGRCFVIVIDGLNENINSKVFSANLELFISEVVQEDFIRVVVTCRTEYYENNFSNLEKSSFAPDLKRLHKLSSHHREDRISDKLFDIYFDYFKIEYQGISEKAETQLLSNFLLLRIYCDTYKNSKFEYIENIYKEELFENYFKTKADEINERLKRDNRFPSDSSFDIRQFITRLVSEMVQTERFANIPLTGLLNGLNEKELYVQFLDENILVKRDLSSEGNIFTDTEVVNFTFDEFRDFLIAQYLINVILPRSSEEFQAFLSKHLVHRSLLLEGCSTFLFFNAKRSKNSILLESIKSQDWFHNVFSRCIFNIEDAQVTDEDKAAILDNLEVNKNERKGIILKLIFRLNPSVYKNLNIDLLLEFLRSLSTQEFETIFTDTFSGAEYGEYNKISQNELLNRIEEITDTQLKERPHIHRIFELLIYMFETDVWWRAQNLYEKYGFRHKEQRDEQLKRALTCKNKALKKEILRFIKTYEIQL